MNLSSFTITTERNIAIAIRKKKIMSLFPKDNTNSIYS